MAQNILQELHELVKKREANPIVGSYTNYLLSKGEDKICLKVSEQAAELVIALKNHDHEEIIHEAADLLYHMTVALATNDVTWNEVSEEMRNRRTSDTQPCEHA